MPKEVHYFEQFLRSTEFCDATIISSSGSEFKIHKLILAASSQYFHVLFTASSVDNLSEKYVFDDITTETLKDIIDWCYNIEISISSDNVIRLFTVADRLSISGLCQQCVSIMIEFLSISNVIGIWNLAIEYNIMDLRKQCFDYIMVNFEQIVLTSDEFEKLKKRQLFSLLVCDELNVHKEECVFESILKWINYNKHKRIKDIAYLLKAVRLDLVKPDYFSRKIKLNPYIIQCTTAIQHIDSMEKFLSELDSIEIAEFERISPETYSRLIDLDGNFKKYRLPHEAILVSSGWSTGMPTRSLELFNSKKNAWIDIVAPDQSARAYHGTVYYKNSVYIIGGYDGIEHFNSCRMLKLETLEWCELPPMHHKRCYVSTVVHDNFIYAIGGHSGHHRENTAERLNLLTSQWGTISPMNFQRSDAACAVLNDLIYICGGFTGVDCLASVEYYCPKSNTWTLISSLQGPRSGLSAVSYNGCIYVLGGFNGNLRLNTVEQYDPKDGRWIFVSPMNTQRSNFACVTLQNRIVVIGGFNGSTTISEVEGYDARKNEWRIMPRLNVCRSAASACVVEGCDIIQKILKASNENYVNSK